MTGHMSKETWEDPICFRVRRFQVVVSLLHRGVALLGVGMNTLWSIQA